MKEQPQWEGKRKRGRTKGFQRKRGFRRKRKKHRWAERVEYEADGGRGE